METLTSPIEQQLCDGLFYWDQISSNWFRLQDRATHDVCGHYRKELRLSGRYEFPTVRFTRAFWDDFSAAFKFGKEERTFDSLAEAKSWIEQGVKDRW